MHQLKLTQEIHLLTAHSTYITEPMRYKREKHFMRLRKDKLLLSLALSAVAIP